MKFNPTKLAPAMLVCLAELIAACATQPYDGNTAVRFAFPSIDIAGRCRTLMSVDDVRQIKRLAHDRSGILKPIDQIVTDHPNETEVKSGHPEKSGDRMTTFQVRKQNGRWMILGKPYTSSETVITG
jgi:hypothetical protein